MSVWQTLSGSFQVKSDSKNDSKNGIWSFAIIANSQNPLQKRLQRYLYSNKILLRSCSWPRILIQSLFQKFILALVRPIILFWQVENDFKKTPLELYFSKKPFLISYSLKKVVFDLFMWDLSHSVVMLNGLINFKSR